MVSVQMPCQAAVRVTLESDRETRSVSVYSGMLER